MIIDVHSHAWQFPEHFTADFIRQARRARSGQEVDLRVGYEAYRDTATPDTRTIVFGGKARLSRLWVDDRTVGDTCSGSAIDYGAEARGVSLGELPAAARKAFHSVEPDDVVELASYPRQQPIEYRLVHDGAVRAIARYFDDGHGGWLLDGVDDCRDG